jgi:CRISPR-associated protein Cmr6
MTFLPLPEEATDTPNHHDRNTGLYFERFFNQYNADASKILETDNKSPNQGKGFWLKKFKSAGNTSALQDAASRQIELVKLLNGKHRFFNSQWHFVTGTGYPHPAENALLWHPVQGVPYLSGAAVKGLLRAWVEQWAGLEDPQKQERLLNWFGSDHKDPKKQQQATRAGDLIFFDALPVKAVRLITDIMTPHYGDWYSEGDKIADVSKDHKRIPADWQVPVPIPFLVVDKASSYLFSIAPRNAQAAARVDMAEVIDCLTQALEWLGAGAKTATGYGQMVFNHQTHDDLDKELQKIYLKKAEESLRDQKELEKKLLKTQAEQAFAQQIKEYSLLEQAYFTQIKNENWANDKNAFWHSNRLEQWLDKLESEPSQRIIENLRQLLNNHIKGLLANPEKLNPKTNEPSYKRRQQLIAHRLNKL